METILQTLCGVVNCFQFVIWRSLTHLAVGSLTNGDMLWIAFNLWFDDLWHTYYTLFCRPGSVVNCFQFVIWRSLTHQSNNPALRTFCCELLSICDLTIFDTPAAMPIVCFAVLWIAFNLWFDDLWHTYNVTGTSKTYVVNCFQFVIWRSLTHLGVFVNFIQCVVNCFQFVIWRSLTHRFLCKRLVSFCCELLSICDLTIFDTPHLWTTRPPF